MSAFELLFIDKRKDAFVSLQTVRRNVVEIGSIYTARRRYKLPPDYKFVQDGDKICVRKKVDARRQRGGVPPDEAGPSNPRPRRPSRQQTPPPDDEVDPLAPPNPVEARRRARRQRQTPLQSTGTDLAEASFVADRDPAAEQALARLLDNLAAPAPSPAAAQSPAAQPSPAAPPGINRADNEEAFGGHAKILKFELNPSPNTVNVAFNAFNGYLNGNEGAAVMSDIAATGDGDKQIRMQVEALIRFRKGNSGDMENDVVGTDRFILVGSAQDMPTLTQSIKGCVNEAETIIANKVASNAMRETGWQIVAVLHIALRVSTYDPHRTIPMRGQGGGRRSVPMPDGQAYVRQPRARRPEARPAQTSDAGGQYIELPQRLAAKRACINVKCHDNRCFEYSVLYCLHRDKLQRNPQRVSVYTQFKNELSFAGVEFPVRIVDIDAFERVNNVGVTVYQADVHSASDDYDLRLSRVPNSDFPQNAVVLLLTDGNDGHYVAVSNIDALLRDSRLGRKQRHCPNCMCTFGSRATLDAHVAKGCSRTGGLSAKVPAMLPDAPRMVFKNNNNRIRSDAMCVASVAHDEWKWAYLLHCTGQPRDVCDGVGLEALLKALHLDASRLQQIFMLTVAMDMSPDEDRAFREATHCYICRKPFGEGVTPVRDHCHCTGEFRGAAHQGCNLNLHNRYVDLPVFVAGLAGMSSRIIRALTESFPGAKLDVRSSRGKRFAGFSWIISPGVRVSFRDLDAFCLGGATDGSVGSARQHFDALSALCDECYDAYGVDMVRYSTVPAFFLDAALDNMSEGYGGIQLLCGDAGQEMYEMLERGIRGGVVMVPHRFAAANLPGMPGYDATADRCEIIELDCNNLYAWALRQKLPVGDFAWCDDAWLRHCEGDGRLLTLDMDGDTGYIFQVDLSYPEELHDRDSMFPLAPDTLELTRDMLSPFHNRMLEKLGAETSKTHRALCGHFLPRKDYVVHGRVLRYYMERGMKLDRIHRCMSFRQAAVFQRFVDENTARRTACTNKSRKLFWKLANVCLVGKLYETVRNRVDYKIVNDERKFVDLSSRPEFARFEIFSPSLVGVEMQRTTAVLDRPIACGLAVLDLAKMHMYQLHNAIVDRLAMRGVKTQLLYSDTDSFYYSVNSPEKIPAVTMMHDDTVLRDLVDWASLPAGHDLHSEENKMVPGKLKFENADRVAVTFAGLRPKLYAIEYADGDATVSRCIAAGVPEAGTMFEMRDYIDCLKDIQGRAISFPVNRSVPGQLDTVSVMSTRIGMNALDDKQFLLDDGISTRPYGHYLNV